jgi:hypothetical protein
MPVRRIMQLTPFRVRQRILNSVGKRVLRFVPQQRRLQVVRKATPMYATTRLATPHSPEHLWVRAGRRFVRARKEPAASPAAVRRDNLNRVVAALDAARVPYHRIPVAEPTRTGLAVPVEHRGAVLALVAPWRRDGARIRRVRRDATVFTVSWPVTDPAGNHLLGDEYGCDVEFWRLVDGYRVAPRANPVADQVTAAEPTVRVPESVISAFTSARDTTAYPSHPVFGMTAPDRVRFPIDVVYTWVDGGDPAWQARKAAAQGSNGWLAAANAQAANNSRFVSREELRYSLRSLYAYAPWVRRIFLVTDDQVPGWLDTAHEQVTVVSHRDLFGETGTLPTFNSQAIESRLHRIPGLAEHFLYLNDDVFFGRPITPEMFFTPGGLTHFFLSKALMGSGPPAAEDFPVNQAAKNNRTLIEQTFGCRITQKMMHTPHASRRSVLAELEQRFPDEVLATAGHQFRHHDDLAMLSSLQHYWAWLTGRATPSLIRYTYADLAEPVTPIRLARLLRSRNLDVFCLNDTDSTAEVAAEQAKLLQDFLPAYFPFPSPYELTGPEGDRPTYSPVTPGVARQLSREPQTLPDAVPVATPPTGEVPEQPDRTPVAKPTKRATERRAKAKNARSTTPSQKSRPGGGTNEPTVHS